MQLSGFWSVGMFVEDLHNSRVGKLVMPGFPFVQHRGNKPKNGYFVHHDWPASFKVAHPATSTAVGNGKGVASVTVE
jgi:hypothetical protein